MATTNQRIEQELTVVPCPSKLYKYAPEPDLRVKSIQSIYFRKTLKSYLTVNKKIISTNL